MSDRKKITHILMIVLILIWTFDTVSISKAVQSVPQITLLFLKYLSALPVIFMANALKGKIRLPKRKDVKKITVCSLVGMVLYYVVEYTAIRHMPISISTVLIGILPAVSYVTDCLIRKRRIKGSVTAAILLSIAGLVLVAQSHKETAGGDLLGFVCCFLCVGIWIIYGFMLRNLEDSYSSEALTLYQMVIAAAVILPAAVWYSLPPLSFREIILYIVLPGMLSCGLGDLIEVRGLIELGTTVTGVYLNLLPVFTLAAGVLILNERVTLLQLIGSAAVIICGIFITTRDDI